jgi:hypothetical protein
VFLLIASSMAGLFWTVYGPGLMFVMGAVFTMVAAAGLVVGTPRARG